MPSECGFPPLRRIFSAPKDGTWSAPALTLTPETTEMLLKNALPLNRGNPGASPSFHPSEEVPEGLVEPLESAALDRHRAFRHLRKVPAALGQGLALVEV